MWEYLGFFGDKKPSRKPLANTKEGRAATLYGCKPQPLSASCSCPLHICVSTLQWSLTLLLQPALPGNVSSDWMRCLEEENVLWYVSRKEVIKEKQPTSFLNWLSFWKAAPSQPRTERWPTAGNEWNHLVLLPSVPIALEGYLTVMCLLHHTIALATQPKCLSACEQHEWWRLVRRVWVACVALLHKSQSHHLPHKRAWAGNWELGGKLYWESKAYFSSNCVGTALAFWNQWRLN